MLTEMQTRLKIKKSTEEELSVTVSSSADVIMLRLSLDGNVFLWIYGNSFYKQQEMIVVAV